MTSCALIFMMWLSKFQFGNCCWDTGLYGWFMRDKSRPLAGWYTFNKDTNINFGDGINYEKDMTNYFDVTVKTIETDGDDTIVSHGYCKLDGKKYHYLERVTKK